MIRPDQIPDAVVEAAARAMALTEYGDEKMWDVYIPRAKSAIAAALSAWPMAHIHEWQRPWMGGMSGADIILPLPEAKRIARQEESDND